MSGKVSVVIPTFGELDKVIQLTQAIQRYPQSELLESLLMDDAYPNYRLSDLVHSPFKVWMAEQNLGFVRMCNQGAKLAAGELLFLLNSDCIPLNNSWLDPMVKMFENPKVGVVGAKLLFPKNPNNEYLIQHAGCEFDGMKGPYHKYLGWLASDERTHFNREVAWVTGAALMTRRDLFLSIGGFDEIYSPRGYFEDVDYNMKVKSLGFQVWYCAESMFIHHVGSSMGAVSKTPEQQQEAAKSFMHNSRTFHKRWDDKIVPDTPAIYVNY